jgi:TPP-dependent pyruvate/acetoin dehydrogenase alpha subunit
LTPHTTADDPKRYRHEDEAKPWAKRDSLIRFKKYLENKGIMKEADFQALEEEVDAQIKESVKRFEELASSKELLDPLSMFDHLYSDVPHFLQEQKDELAKHLSKGKAPSQSPAESGRRS